MFSFPLLCSCSDSEDFYLNLKPLSQEEKLQDFQYLYDAVKENYPMLEMNKIKYNVDWLDRKDKYIKHIKGTKNDEDFAKAIETILNDLNDYKTGILFDIDKSNEIPKPSQELFNNVIKRDTVMKRYRGSKPGDSKKSSTPSSSPMYEKNIADTTVMEDIIPNEMAYIRIPKALDTVSRNDDEKNLHNYLKNIINYKTLIVDLRGSSSIDMSYLCDFLFSSIIDRSYCSNFYFVFKNSKLTHELLESTYDSNTMPLNIDKLAEEGLPLLPPEVLKDFSYFKKYPINIAPNSESINFKGKIYIFTDPKTANAASIFASFAKYSHLATLVGSASPGQELLSPIIYDSLPNSGYVFRLHCAITINQDGSWFDNKGVEPDILVSEYGFITDNLKDDFYIKKILELEKR